MHPEDEAYFSNDGLDDILEIRCEAQLEASPIYQTALSEGWTIGTPRGYPLVALERDGDLCENLNCARCGRKGLAYWPLKRDLDMRVLAVCECGHVEEL